jgi:hypothetical protein
MYYDIFFAIPQGEIITEPTVEQQALIKERGPGLLINFPGVNQTVVYAVKDFEGRRFHCLVTESQLDHIEADNVPYFTFKAAAAVFKAQPQEGEDAQPWHGKAPAHVFNPAGVVSRKGGKNYIHRVARETEELLEIEE